ncbi:MAG TPA: hypothetical protein VF914_14290 [Chloroflexia bacterium]
MPVEHPYLLDEIMIEMAAVELAYLGPHGLQEAYDGIPPDPENVTLPFSYGRFYRVRYPQPGWGDAETGTMGASTATDPRIYVIERIIDIGQASGNQAKQEKAARRWADLFRACYMSNLTLNGKCQWVLPSEGMFLLDNVGGQQFAGLLHEVHVGVVAEVEISQ